MVRTRAIGSFPLSTYARKFAFEFRILEKRIFVTELWLARDFKLYLGARCLVHLLLRLANTASHAVSLNVVAQQSGFLVAIWSK